VSVAEIVLLPHASAVLDALNLPARSNPLCGVIMVGRQWNFVRGKGDSGAQRVG
jgi:hypothetical protein